MGIVWLILTFIGVLGVLIFFHELGHFLLAKKMGVKVLKFSLGFGPKIIGKTVGDTEYLISAFPLGGYVKMLGESPDDEVEAVDEEMSFSAQPPWKRMAIVAAGPIFNIILTVLLYSFIYVYGVSAISTIIGYVEKDSPAYHSGLRDGDRVTSIDGLKVEEWDTIDGIIRENIDKKVSITLIREGQEMVVEVLPEKKMGKNLFAESIEIGTIGIWPFVTSVVGEVIEGSPAEAGGLKMGDRIVSIEGVEVGQWSEVVKIIRGKANEELSIVVERGKEILDITLTPAPYTEKLENGEEITVGRIGISYGEPMRQNLITKRHNPFTAFFMGVEQTWEITRLTLLVIKKLIVGDIPAKTLAGPIGIAQMTGQVAKRGFTSLLAFMALLSINLGILNLLPIPILDGGHLVFFTIESITGKPLSEKKLEIAQKIGFMFLMLLMALAFYNDILRLFGGG
ncbi:MAG: RIP metalloprotease RseP [Thermodesulfobacteriota bacterium]